MTPGPVALLARPLLALAPVLDQMLHQRDQSAVLAFSSACMPARAMAEGRGICADGARRVEALLESPSAPATVVLHAHWQRYQLQPGFATDLRATLDWLLDRGHRVVLVGPVPVWAHDVPDVLIHRSEEDRQRLLSQTRSDYLQASAPFWRAIDSYQRPGLHILDPSAVLCQPQCGVSGGGGVWYRDSHHLSQEGSAQLDPLLLPVLDGMAEDHREILD